MIAKSSGMEKRFFLEQFACIAASFFVSVLIVILLPIAIAIPMMLATFAAFMYMALRRAAKGSGDRLVVGFRCAQCKTEHKCNVCPNCGSRIKELTLR